MNPWGDSTVIVTTTPSVEGKKITSYHGVVVGEAILGANVFRDIFASITDIVGGRSGAYEEELAKASAAPDEIAAQRAELNTAITTAETRRNAAADRPSGCRRACTRESGSRQPRHCTPSNTC